jgi:hypothetical protein
MTATKVDDYVARGATREEVNSLPRHAITPVLDDAALHGLAGDIVRVVAPESEAAPVAILAHLLIAMGNLIGGSPYALVENTPHRCNEFALIVGGTSSGRKGQAWSTPRMLLERTDPDWSAKCTIHGLSSGEGLIHQVRDPITRQEPIKEHGRVVDYQAVVVDEGVVDKRLLVIESEFASVLRRMNGETNTLSAVLRTAWDSGTLRTATKHNSEKATGAHISVIGHITPDELMMSLNETEQANGFANRFLFLSVKRAQLLPEGGRVPEYALRPLIDRLRAVIEWAGGKARLYERDAEARDLWARVYQGLSEERPGLLGKVLSRGAPHVLRLSMLYAVLDRSEKIRADHLVAAVALWDYAEASARQIFGDRLGLSTADTTLEALRAAPNRELPRTAINALFSRNKPVQEIQQALDYLRLMNKATMRRETTAGRPVEIWRAL